MTATRYANTASEALLQKAVEDTLTAFKWTWVHHRPARTASGWRTAITGHKGLPDIIAAKNGTVLAIELKSARGTQSPEQVEWAKALGARHFLLLRPDGLDAFIEWVQGFEDGCCGGNP